MDVEVLREVSWIGVISGLGGLCVRSDLMDWTSESDTLEDIMACHSSARSFRDFTSFTQVLPWMRSQLERAFGCRYHFLEINSALRCTGG